MLCLVPGCALCNLPRCWFHIQCVLSSLCLDTTRSITGFENGNERQTAPSRKHRIWQTSSSPRARFAWPLQKIWHKLLDHIEPFLVKGGVIFPDGVLLRGLESSKNNIRGWGEIDTKMIIIVITLIFKAKGSSRMRPRCRIYCYKKLIPFPITTYNPSNQCISKNKWNPVMTLYQILHQIPWNHLRQVLPKRHQILTLRTYFHWHPTVLLQL